MDKKLVETFYGKHSKYEVVKDQGGVFGSPKFYIRKDGKPYKGGYSRLAAAVADARKAAGC